MSSFMIIEPWGGVNEYGRNCFYIKCGKKRILLDCGILKGTKKLPDLNSEKVKRLDYVFLSHGHIDHYGALHELYAMGYKGKVYMTKDTKRQINDYLNNHRCIEAETIEGLGKSLVWIKIDEEMSILWGRSSHAQGAFWIVIKIEDKSAFYSGDFNSESRFLAHDDPVKMLKDVKINKGIMDCGSGDADDNYFDIVKKLENDIEDARKKRGSVLFFSNAYGRGSELFLIFIKELKEVKFAVTMKFLKSVEELVKVSPEIDINEWKQLKENIEIIDKSFDISSIKDNSKVYFCENINAKIELEYDILNENKMYKNNKIIFTSRQPKNSIGMYMINNKERFKAQIACVNVKAHQSKKEAEHLADKMKIHECIYFHSDNNAD